MSVIAWGTSSTKTAVKKNPKSEERYHNGGCPAISTCVADAVKVPIRVLKS
jgi:hypothetical protein